MSRNFKPWDINTQHYKERTWIAICSFLILNSAGGCSLANYDFRRRPNRINNEISRMSSPNNKAVTSRELQCHDTVYLEIQLHNSYFHKSKTIIIFDSFFLLCIKICFTAIYLKTQRQHHLIIAFPHNRHPQLFCVTIHTHKYLGSYHVKTEVQNLLFFSRQSLDLPVFG